MLPFQEPFREDSLACTNFQHNVTGTHVAAVEDHAKDIFVDEKVLSYSGVRSEKALGHYPSTPRWLQISVSCNEKAGDRKVSRFLIPGRDERI